MDGVVEVADVDEPDGHADERDDLGELLAELVQLLLQRRLVLLRGRHLVADLADLRVHPRGHHDAHRLARADVGALGTGGWGHGGLGDIVVGMWWAWGQGLGGVVVGTRIWGHGGLGDFVVGTWWA